MYIRIELYAQTYLSLLYYNFRKGYLFFIKKLIKKVMLFLIKKETTNILCRFEKNTDGDYRDRTDDLLHAMQTLSQLS